MTDEGKQDDPVDAAGDGAFPVRRAWHREASVALLLACVAGSAATVALTPIEPSLEARPSWGATAAFVGFGAAALLSIWSLWRSVVRQLRRDGEPENAYATHLAGVGTSMLVSGLIAAAVLAALIVAGVVSLAPDVSSVSSTERYRQAVYLLTASGLAMIGSQFFVANTLWNRGFGALEREPFDVGHFWAGLALRMGEAQVFTLVVAVFLARQGRLTYEWLPILGLFLGMYVKTAEAIIFGLARRVFTVVSSLVEPEARSERHSTAANAISVEPSTPGTTTTKPATQTKPLASVSE